MNLNPRRRDAPEPMRYFVHVGLVEEPAEEPSAGIH
jgi:hypothetical protein